MNNLKPRTIKIAFVVGKIPTVSGTFLIDQIAGLLDRGIDVEIFSFHNPETLDNISEKFFRYRMADKTKYLEMPKNRVVRLMKAIPKIIRLFSHPKILFRLLDFRTYGRDALSLRLLYRVAPFIGKKYDLFHVHFGTRANDFLIIKEILELKQKMITSFYGYDASYIFNRQGDAVYDRLRKECHNFLVMSENMKQRLVAHGFDPQTIVVHPVGIEPKNYLFEERQNHGGLAEIISVGRFVEKKGFDDLFRALAIVRGRLGDVFHCTIVGDGQLRDVLYNLADNLGIRDNLDFRGYMPMEEITKLFLEKDFFVQPSKTAKNGDME